MAKRDYEVKNSISQPLCSLVVVHTMVFPKKSNKMSPLMEMHNKWTRLCGELW